jgi:hypothetical protein
MNCPFALNSKNTNKKKAAFAEGRRGGSLQVWQGLGTAAEGAAAYFRSEPIFLATCCLSFVVHPGHAHSFRVLTQPEPLGSHD